MAGATVRPVRLPARAEFGAVSAARVWAVRWACAVECGETSGASKAGLGAGRSGGALTGPGRPLHWLRFQEGQKRGGAFPVPSFRSLPVMGPGSRDSCLSPLRRAAESGARGVDVGACWPLSRPLPPSSPRRVLGLPRRT